MESQETDKIIFKDRIDKAKTISYGIMKAGFSDDEQFTLDDVFIVWFCKTLQNWKALVSASYPGAPFIEVTYNGDKKETYFDVYKKAENIKVPD